MKYPETFKMRGWVLGKGVEALLGSNDLKGTIVARRWSAARSFFWEWILVHSQIGDGDTYRDIYFVISHPDITEYGDDVELDEDGKLPSMRAHAAFVDIGVAWEYLKRRARE